MNLILLQLLQQSDKVKSLGTLSYSFIKTLCDIVSYCEGSVTWVFIFHPVHPADFLGWRQSSEMDFQHRNPTTGA